MNLDSGAAWKELVRRPGDTVAVLHATGLCTYGGRKGQFYVIRSGPPSGQGRERGRARRPPTDEPQGRLREGQRARVQQQVQAVRAVLRREHPQQHQEEARVRGRPQAGSRRVFAGEDLQGDGLHT